MNPRLRLRGIPDHGDTFESRISFSKDDGDVVISCRKPLESGGLFPRAQFSLVVNSQHSIPTRGNRGGRARLKPEEGVHLS